MGFPEVRVGIIDYGMGNLLSVFHALEYLGADVSLLSRPEELLQVDRAILPGVGAFRDCIANLKASGFHDALQEFVLQKQRPIFGICLGMQVMGAQSLEGGVWEGMGWIDGQVVRLQPSDPALRIPQIGWNNLTFSPACPLFQHIPAAADFYFVHSYYLHCTNPQTVAATCDYGGPITAAVVKGNIFGTQFHPEKSQEYGLTLLDNFLHWNP